MTLQRIRRTAAAALVASLALGVPAHAAGRASWTAPPGWLAETLQWIARLWTGGSPPQGPAPARTKAETGGGSTPNSSTTPTPPPGTSPDYGAGIDPNG
jgi:hypothetical protein